MAPAEAADEGRRLPESSELARALVDPGIDPSTAKERLSPPRLGDDEDEGRINDLDDNQQDISLQVRGKRETALKQIRFDIGIRRRDSRYQPYVRARHSKAFTTDGPWAPHLTNSFYYFTKSKFEYRGQADFDRVIGQDFFFRPTTVVRWYQNNSSECNDG